MVGPKAFVTATADSVNGGGTSAGFLRLLVCMGLLYLSIVNFPICAQLLLIPNNVKAVLANLTQLHNLCNLKSCLLISS